MARRSRRKTSRRYGSRSRSRMASRPRRYVRSRSRSRRSNARNIRIVIEQPGTPRIGTLDGIMQMRANAPRVAKF